MSHEDVRPRRAPYQKVRWVKVYQVCFPCAGSGRKKIFMKSGSIIEIPCKECIGRGEKERFERMSLD